MTDLTRFIEANDLDGLQDALTTATPWERRQALNLASTLGSMPTLQLLLPFCVPVPGHVLRVPHAIAHAAENGHEEAVTFLLEATGQQDSDVFLAMQAAVKHGHESLALALSPTFAKTPYFAVFPSMMACPALVHRLFELGRPAISGTVLLEAAKLDHTNVFEEVRSGMDAFEVLALVVAKPPSDELEWIVETLTPELTPPQRAGLSLLDAAHRGDLVQLDHALSSEMDPRAWPQALVLSTTRVAEAQRRPDRKGSHEECLERLLSATPLSHSRDPSSAIANAGLYSQHPVLRTIIRRASLADVIRHAIPAAARGGHAASLEHLLSQVSRHSLPYSVLSDATRSPDCVQLLMDHSPNIPSSSHLATAAINSLASLDTLLPYSDPTTALWAVVQAVQKIYNDTQAQDTKLIRAFAHLAPMINDETCAQVLGHLPESLQQPFLVLGTRYQLHEHLSEAITVSPSGHTKVRV
jgi:hypothetical protein